jgi:hypothetical protein
MFNRNRLLALGFVFAPVVAAACGGMEPTGEEDVMQDEALNVVDVDIVQALPTCLTQAADATMTVGPDADGHYWDSVESPVGTYSTGYCAGYVVDITVPGNYKLPSSNWNYFSIRGSAPITLNQYNCDNAYESIKIYKKSWNIFTQTWSSWTTVANSSGNGVWASDPDAGAWCALPADGHEFRASGIAGFNDMYRVVFTPKFYNVQKDAKVSWTWNH